MNDNQRTLLNGSIQDTTATYYGAIEEGDQRFKSNEEIIEEIYDDLGTGRY